jgi:hypothetical protein
MCASASPSRSILPVATQEFMEHQGLRLPMQDKISISKMRMSTIDITEPVSDLRYLSFKLMTGSPAKRPRQPSGTQQSSIANKEPIEDPTSQQTGRHRKWLPSLSSKWHGVSLAPSHRPTSMENHGMEALQAPSS